MKTKQDISKMPLEDIEDDFENLQAIFNKKYQPTDNNKNKYQPNTRNSGNSDEDNHDHDDQIDNSYGYSSTPHLKSDQYNQDSIINSFKQQNVKSKKQNEPRIKSHQPVVIDEDIEIFKNKLEGLINNFKSETLSEFIEMKKGMLEEQNQTIVNETSKLTNLLNSQKAEVNSIREDLAQKTHQNEKLEQKIQNISNYAGKYKMKFDKLKSLGKYFSGWIKYKEYRHIKLKFNKIAIQHNQKSLKKNIFNSIKNIYSNNNIDKLRIEFEAKMRKELEDLSFKYNKEIEMLTKRLQEYKLDNSKLNQEKIEIQENLKKAFVRGVCALNFEAMSVLNIQEQSDQPTNTINNNITTNNQPQQQYQPYSSQQIHTNINQQFYNNETLPKSQYTKDIYDDEVFKAISKVNDKIISDQIPRDSSPKKEIIFLDNQRGDSKGTKWKAAPILGIDKENRPDNNINYNQQNFQTKKGNIPLVTFEDYDEEPINNNNVPEQYSSKNIQENPRVIKANEKKIPFQFKETPTNNKQSKTSFQIDKQKQTLKKK